MPHALLPFVPRTKLRPSRLPDDILLRTRLFEKLDRLSTLALIIAPAGYGKTTLISSWLVQADQPYAWLSLESADSTLPAFLAAFVAAVRTLFPGFGGVLLDLLQDAALELAPALVLPILLNELDALEQDFTLVLDDYHHITCPSIHQVIWGVLTYPRRPLRLVVTARHDPPVPLRLRSCGAVIEIRAAELSLTAAETSEFLRGSVRQPLAAECVAGLVRQAEGWAVPLRLLAIFMCQRQDSAAPKAVLHLCERSLLDYLDAEVIGHLPTAVQAFLAYTSVLPLLNGALCDDVLTGALPGIDSTAVLQELEQAGLFVERLDEAGTWYRYHSLFRTLLERRLRITHDPPTADAIEQRARSWYEQHDLAETLRAHTICLGGQSTAGDVAPHTQSLPVRDNGAAHRACNTPGTFSAALPVRPPAHVARNLHAELTFREMDVLLLLNQRLTNKEIGRALGIACETVRQHTVNIYRKLGVDNRRQAIVQAHDMGLMEASR